MFLLFYFLIAMSINIHGSENKIFHEQGSELTLAEKLDFCMYLTKRALRDQIIEPVLYDDTLKNALSISPEEYDIKTKLAFVNRLAQIKKITPTDEEKIKLIQTLLLPKKKNFLRRKVAKKKSIALYQKVLLKNFLRPFSNPTESLNAMFNDYQNYARLYYAIICNKHDDIFCELQKYNSDIDEQLLSDISHCIPTSKRSIDFFMENYQENFGKIERHYKRAKKKAEKNQRVENNQKKQSVENKEFYIKTFINPYKSPMPPKTKTCAFL